MKQMKRLLVTAALAASGCCVAASAANFNDVPGSFWASKEITWANGQGLMNGTTATTFDPTGVTRRGQMTAILYRYAGSPAVSGEIPYADVTSANYYADASIWAKKNNILAASRLMAASLNAGDAIGRAEFCTMVYNFAKYSGKDVSTNGSTAFTDLNGLSDEAKTAIAWANQKGIVNGTSANSFNPGGSLTRAAAAAMLYRYENMGSSSGSTTKPDEPKQDTTTGTDQVVLAKGKTVNVSLSVGQMLPLVDELDGNWTCQYQMGGEKIAAITYDFGSNRQTLLGLSAGTTTLTIYSSLDYTTVLTTLKVTVGGSSSSSTGSSNTGSGSTDTASDLDANMDIRNEIVRLTNEVRRENGLPDLEVNDALMNAAQEYAMTCAEKGSIEHDVALSQSLCRKYGWDYGAGENLGRGGTGAQSIVNGWVNSPGHLRAILNTSATAIGVGAYTNSNGQTFYSQLFGNNPEYAKLVG